MNSKRSMATLCLLLLGLLLLGGPAPAAARPVPIPLEGAAGVNGRGLKLVAVKRISKQRRSKMVMKGSLAPPGNARRALIGA